MKMATPHQYVWCFFSTRLARFIHLSIGIYYRFNASDDDIRRAYRKIVLKHHPDKRKAQGENVITDDDYFTCITKAYETLGWYTKCFGK